jgi:hypothetical protein
MVRVHSGLPFQVAAPLSTCDSLPAFDYVLRRRYSIRCNRLFDSTGVGFVLLVRLWERSAV